MFSTVGTNDLKSLKTYLDSDETKVDEYVNAIEYEYNVAPSDLQCGCRRSPSGPSGSVFSGHGSGICREHQQYDVCDDEYGCLS
ncbi:MAG: hypothetical protein ACLRMN_09100 [Mediterraneibacter gnavus]